MTGARAALREFLGRRLDCAGLHDDDDLFERGLANSLFAMELVTFVEGTFRIAVESEDLELDNFRSVDALVRLVERKSVGEPA